MKKFLLMNLVVSLFVLFLIGCSISPTDNVSNQDMEKNTLNTSYNPLVTPTIITWNVPNYGKGALSYVQCTYGADRNSANTGWDLECYNAGIVLSYQCINWPKGYKIRFYQDLASPSSPIENSPMVFPTKNYFTTTIDATGNEYVPDTRKVPYSGHFSISSFRVIK